MSKKKKARPTEERVEFVFTEDDDYRDIYVNGAFGGVSPRGDFRIDLYQESQIDAERIIHKLSEDGSLEEEIERSPKGPQFLRAKKVRVTMTIDNAESVANWILRTIKEFREKQTAQET